MGLGQLLHVPSPGAKPPGSALGPCRHPAEVERTPIEDAFVPPPSRLTAECDELAPVVRPHLGELPVDRDAEARREIARTVFVVMWLIFMVGFMVFFVRR